MFSLLQDIETNKMQLQHDIQMNNQLEKKFIQLIEFKGEKNEIDKFKSYINDIETITTIFLKLSCRLAKIENDLLTFTDDNAQAKVFFSSFSFNQMNCPLDFEIKFFF